MSSNFHSECLSLESLKLLTRCDLIPAAAHTLPTLDGLIPTLPVMEVRLQCVAPAAFPFNVRRVKRDFSEAASAAMRPNRDLFLRMPARPASAWRRLQ